MHSTRYLPLSLTLAAAVLGLGATPRIAVQREPAVGMFRGGPDHRGVYEGGGPVRVGLAWRAMTDGDVVSSPTVAGSTVFVGSDDGGLYAFDLATGERHWRSDLGSPVSSSPAVGVGLVFAPARDGSVTAVDAASGQRRWRLTTDPVAPFPWGHESGDYYVSSPALVDDVLVFGAGDGAVYAVDAASGRRRWRAATMGRVRSSPAIADGHVYVGAFDGRVYCFDLATGRELWRFETAGVSLKSGDFGYDRRSVQSSPVVAGGVVYVGARDGFLYAIDARTGKERWHVDHQISWVNSSPAYDRGLVFAGSSDGHFVQAVDTTGHEVWRAPTQTLVWSSPSVASAVVYFGDGGGWLRAVDRDTGKELWSFRTGASIYSSPAIAGEYVVVGSSDGGVYALRAGNGPVVRRAVFFDSALVPRARINASLIARTLGARGYDTLDAAGLARFLQDRITDRAPSVVVFAIDFLPAMAAPGDSGRSLFRRYLESGGKVVWSGLPPRILPPVPRPGEFVIDWPAATDATGVPHDSALFDVRGARATPEGARWGLNPRWRDAWSVAPEGVSEVLGMDEWGLAAAWVRNFGGAEGTGLVRVPSDDPAAIYYAAEYRGRGTR